MTKKKSNSKKRTVYTMDKPDKTSGKKVFHSESVQQEQHDPKVSEEEISVETTIVPVVDAEDNNDSSEQTLISTNDENITESTETVSAADQEKTNEEKMDDSKQVSLEGRSQLFIEIIKIAESYDKLEKQIDTLKLKVKNLEERNKELNKKQNNLASENSGLNSEIKRLSEDKRMLSQQLNELEIDYKTKLEEISQLQTDVANRNEAIDIVKANKNESEVEYKNALAAELKAFYVDFTELKEMGTTDEIANALIDTFEEVIKVLRKNDINL